MKIPMLGKTESLNASVATGIILYEYVRQKRGWGIGGASLNHALERSKFNMKLHTVMVEPEIPQNTRKYC